MWDQRYAEEGFAYGTSPNDFLADTVSVLPPKGRILCLAEGEGRNAVYLAEKGFTVECVDASALGLEKAAALAKSRSVTIKTERADLKDYSIAAGRYDGIISIFCHLPPPLQKHVHRQVYEGLRDGGIFILEGFSKDQINNTTGGPRNPELLMELETVKTELSPLAIQHARETKRNIQEGAYHNGIGAVIQIVGVKTSGSSND